MQRHGGRTRPVVPATANPVAKPSRDSANDECRDDGKGGNTACTPPSDTKQ
jgi:hypothetical protein